MNCQTLGALKIAAGIALILFICSGSLESAEITAFTGNGELRCEGLETGTIVRVEWAGSAQGPWRSWHSATPMDAIQVDSNGTIQVDVPMFYRVVDIFGDMVSVQGGTFTMGDTWGDGYSYELPTHSVSVGSFYMSKHEATNEQMADILNWAEDRGKLMVSSSTVENAVGDGQELLDLDSEYCQISWNGSSFVADSGKGNYPCVEVSWYGAAAYCNYRSEKESLTPCYDLSDWTCDWSANGYRLPTEAEWEYVAKGGRDGVYTKYSGSDNIDSVAWYRENSDACGNSGFYEGHGTLPVGRRADNELGIYDMSGNVYEWCQDIWHDDYNGAPTDGSAWMSGGDDDAVRVLRGGYWHSSIAFYCRVAYRARGRLDSQGNGSGFRCVR